ncbi:MAG: hypothetical protein JO168_06850 [Solirubrobacterales bacterium]|nr:hypothetical protein [Solirubrobacterales bacterium]
MRPAVVGPVVKVALDPLALAVGGCQQLARQPRSSWSIRCVRALETLALERHRGHCGRHRGDVVLRGQATGREPRPTLQASDEDKDDSGARN